MFFFTVAEGPTELIQAHLDSCVCYTEQMICILCTAKWLHSLYPCDYCSFWRYTMWMTKNRAADKVHVPTFAYSAEPPNRMELSLRLSLT